LFSIGVKFRLTLFAVTALTILSLSIMPNPPVPSTGILSWDKVQHALAYAGLASVAGWALLPLVSPPVRAWRYALIFALGFGVLMELLQAWLPFKRSGDIGDIVADALGGLMIYGLARLASGQLLKKYRKNV
jgi:VanZ family protein